MLNLFTTINMLQYLYINNIGLVYADQGKKDEVLEYFNKSLDIVKLKTLGKDHLDVATSYGTIGSIYEEQGKYEKVFEYDNKAFKLV